MTESCLILAAVTRKKMPPMVKQGEQVSERAREAKSMRMHAHSFSCPFSNLFCPCFTTLTSRSQVWTRSFRLLTLHSRVISNAWDVLLTESLRCWLGRDQQRTHLGAVHDRVHRMECASRHQGADHDKDSSVGSLVEVRPRHLQYLLQLLPI